MACTNCGSRAAAGCGCAVQAGDNVTITGGGTPGDPWVINADPAGGDASTVVTSEDGSVVVTDSTVGDVTTYDLSVEGGQGGPVPTVSSGDDIVVVTESQNPDGGINYAISVESTYSGDYWQPGDPGSGAITLPLGGSGTIAVADMTVVGSPGSIIVQWDPGAAGVFEQGGVYLVTFEVQGSLSPTMVDVADLPLVVSRVHSKTLIPSTSFRFMPAPVVSGSGSILAGNTLIAHSTVLGRVKTVPVPGASLWTVEVAGDGMPNTFPDDMEFTIVQVEVNVVRVGTYIAP